MSIQRKYKGITYYMYVYYVLSNCIHLESMSLRKRAANGTIYPKAMLYRWCTKAKPPIVEKIYVS